MERTITFTPAKIRINGKESKYSMQKILDYIDTANGVSIYDNKKKNQIHWHRFGTSKCFELVYELSDSHLSEHQIVDILSQTGFTTGYVYDKEFVTWQMMKSIQYYEMLGKDHAKLKKKIDSTGLNLEIDISTNYGRKEFFFKSRLMIAPTMFISKQMEEYLPFDKLMAYKDAHQVSFFQDIEVIKIELFDNPFDSHRKSLELKKLWVYLSFNDLIQKFQDSFGNGVVFQNVT